MNPLGKRLDRLARSETRAHQLNDPALGQRPDRDRRGTALIVTMVALGVFGVAALSASRDNRDPVELIVATQPDPAADRDESLNFLPDDLRADLRNVQTAIDHRLRLDVAQCMRRRGWDTPNPVLQRPTGTDREAPNVASGPIPDVPAGLTASDRALFANHSDSCLFRSDWNLGNPIDSFVGMTAEQASDAVALDPAFAAAQVERNTCLAALPSGVRQQRTSEEFTRCENAYSSVVRPLYDGYLNELLLADPDLDQRIAELQRNVDIYRDLLDEIENLD